MTYPTNPIYKLLKDDQSSEIYGVKTEVEKIITFIPLDPANTDYQEYLEWVAAGNTAEAAD